MEFVQMLILGVLSSNIIACTGYGVISLQSEKRSFLFVLTTLATTISTILVAGLLFSVLNIYVLIPLNVEFLGIIIMAILAVVFTYISRYIVKVVSVEQYYLYEKSYQFAIQTITIVAVLLLIDYSKSFLTVMFQLAMFSVGFMLVQLLFYPLYEKLDNTKVLKPARNVPLILYTLSILAMIFSAIYMMI